MSIFRFLKTLLSVNKLITFFQKRKNLFFNKTVLKVSLREHLKIFRVFKKKKITLILVYIVL